MELVYACEPTPEVLRRSVYLAGPSGRSDWRPAAIAALEEAGFDGTVFVPMSRNSVGRDEIEREFGEWQQTHRELADVVAFWLSEAGGSQNELPAGIEFGESVEGGRLIYGRAAGAPGGYLDERYRRAGVDGQTPNDEPSDSLRQLAERVVEAVGAGAERRGGERFVPLVVWRSRPFQAWYTDLRAAGHRLDRARVLWTFFIPPRRFLLSFALRVKVWLAAEERHKENEFILSRTDIATICAYTPDTRSHHWLDTRVVLVKEYRAPARTSDGYLHDLPGGSSFRADADPLEVAAQELQQETGLTIPAGRFRMVAARQMAGTFGTHKGHVFAVRLTPDELHQMTERARRGTAMGVAEETERTYIEVRTLREILRDSLVDHATLGMIAQVCLESE